MASLSTAMPATPQGGGGGNSVVASLNDFWKYDFGVLEAAGKTVLQALRDDEAAPDADLYRRINSSTTTTGASHLYFYRKESDHTTAATDPQRPAISALPSVKLLESVPLPPLLSEKFQTGLTANNRMGLLPEANLAWMSVDNQLYLWSYDRTPQRAGAMRSIGQVQDYCSWQIPRGQSILTVGIAAPKKGIFKNIVEWCLVVTTADQAILCALARYSLDAHASQKGQGFAHGEGILRLIPTRFVLNVGPIWSVAATRSGRIFLGGRDGHLYEMDYAAGEPKKEPTSEDQLAEFYDGDKEVPNVLYSSDNRGVTQKLWAGSKRILETVASSSGGSKPKKCRKLDHSSDSFATSRLAKAVVPDIFLQATDAIFSNGKSFLSGKGKGPITKILIDEERSCLYTLNSMGWIASFDLVQNQITAVMDTAKTARLYLEAVARGSMYPPPTRYGSSVADIMFPGGGVSAQAGVGNMEGARAILKMADFVGGKNGEAGHGRGGGKNILTPTDIHIVSRKESSRLTLVAISKGGLRYYISSLAKKVVTVGPPPFLGTDRKADPLAPSQQFTLCHIRAPPSLDNNGQPYPEDTLTKISSPDANNQSVVTLDDEVALVPKVLGGKSNKMLPLDASFYQDGQMILAVNSGEPVENRGAGDIVFATAPDSIARKRMILVNNAATPAAPVTTTSHTFEVAGGLSEALFLPLHNTYPPTPSTVVPTLTGGRVWCISQSTIPISPVLTLALASQTPSDSELGVGLAPAYSPPSKRSTGQKARGDGAAVASREVVASKPNVGILLTKATIQALSNVLLSRPLRYGISVRPGQIIKKPAETQQLYRLSSRFGYNGFSATAGERLNPREKTINNLKSARLSPWLLRPPVVPLNAMAIQHLLPSRKMVALNAGGLHYFGLHSILVSLADALMSAGPGGGSDKYVANFFTSFGYKEGCAMCVLLAIGFGPAAAGETQAPELQQRAIRAALARAFVPRLVRLMDASVNGDSTGYRSRSASDPAVPAGYEFRPSCLSEGIDAVVSRLLRPVWHKPAVVVTEGRTIKHGSSSRVTAAKVELLLDDVTLEKVRTPLFALQSLMKSTFAPAVAKVPGKIQKKESSAMEIDEEVGENHFLTRIMSYRGHLRTAAAGATSHNGQLTQSEAETLARLFEERNLHSLYRLLSRTVQLLSLLPLLRKAQSKPDLPEVDWGLLHGVTFAQLVLTREGHERLESVLNSLVTASPTNANAADSSSADSDELAGQFADHCYLYFSPGSRFAYFGFRFAHDALLRSEPNSTQRTVLSKNASECFRKAARHWYSAQLIVGGFFHNTDSESSEQKALRAMQFDSPLAKATSLLIQLGDVVGVVDVCLITASNFGGKEVRDASSGIAIGDDKSTSMLSWEHGLYHKRPEGQDVDPRPSTPSRATPSSGVAVGASVTSKDALETCHALVFHHLLTLLDSPNIDLALRMLSACVASPDTKFLHALFSHLLKSNHTQTLLKVESDELEKWLKGSGVDPNILFRYYYVQRRKYQAGEVLWNRAKDASLDLSLQERVECLTRALDCFNGAREDLFGATSSGPVRYDELESLIVEVQERLDVAKLQLRVLSKIDAKGIQLPEGQLKKLSSSLVDISDLFNDFATPHQMFDVSLMIFHACRKNEASSIRTLWKTVIVHEILPCATRSEEVYAFLQGMIEGSLLDETVTLLSENASASESQRLFESGEWLPKVQNAVISLGLEVFGNQADYVFPIDFIATLLEGLRTIYALSATPEAPEQDEPWPLQTFVSVGVPYLLILDAYEALADSREREGMGGIDSQTRFDHIRIIVEIYEYWVRSADAFGDRRQKQALEQLSSAVASHGLQMRIDSIKADLEALKGVRIFGSVDGTITTLKQVEDAIKLIA